MTNPNYDIANIASQIHRECHQNADLYQDGHGIAMCRPDYTVSYISGDKSYVSLEIGCRGDGDIWYGISPTALEVNRGEHAQETQWGYIWSADDDAPVTDLRESASVLSMVRHAHAYRRSVDGING